MSEGPTRQVFEARLHYSEFAVMAVAHFYVTHGFSITVPGRHNDGPDEGDLTIWNAADHQPQIYTIQVKHRRQHALLVYPHRWVATRNGKREETLFVDEAYKIDKQIHNWDRPDAPVMAYWWVEANLQRALYIPFATHPDWKLTPPIWDKHQKRECIFREIRADHPLISMHKLPQH
jgi:hypothetical protein